MDLIAVVQDEAEKVKLLLDEIIEDYDFYEIASGYELKLTEPIDLEKTALLK